MEILKVDIEKIGLNASAPTDEDYGYVGEQLFKAFETLGFVYILNHGVSKENIEKSMETSEIFFNLPLESKKQILRDPKIQQGYVEAGQELFNSKLVISSFRYSYSHFLFT